MNITFRAQSWWFSVSAAWQSGRREARWRRQPEPLLQGCSLDTGCHSWYALRLQRCSHARNNERSQKWRSLLLRKFWSSLSPEPSGSSGWKTYSWVLQGITKATRARFVLFCFNFILIYWESFSKLDMLFSRYVALITYKKDKVAAPSI